MKTESLINTFETDRRPYIADETRNGVICRHLRTHFGRHDHMAITPAIVGRYTVKRINGEIGSPSQSSTVRLELARLVSVLKHAKKHRLVADTPHIDLPPEPEAKDRWLTWSEYTLIHMEGDARTRLAMDIAIETAARPGFIAKLQWAEVDMVRNVVNFQANVRTQTKKKRVPVPISERLRPILESAYQTRGVNPYVLGRSTNWYPGFKRAARAVDMEDVTRHTLRHTKATWMAQKGVSMWKIAGVLGDSLDTVTKRYLHHSPDHLRDAVDARDME